MRKKMLSFALALIMCLSLIPTALAASESPVAKFTDVPADAPYYDALEYAVHNGYISGTSATTFSPNTYLTRAQFVTILGRMMGVSTTSGVTKFKDVPTNAWYAPYVAWAADLGVVSGVSATQFAPDSILTVEQVGTMLTRYLTSTGTKAVVQKEGVKYADNAKIASWAATSMGTMRYYGIMLPDANGNINPQSQVRRSDGVVYLVAFARAIGMGEEFKKEEPQVEPNPPEPPVEVGPFHEGELLYNTGITAKDLAPASWSNVTEFIWPHSADDFEAACNNVVYMFMHDKSEMTFTYDESYDYESLKDYVPLYTSAGYAVGRVFGYNGWFTADKVYTQTQGYWKNGVYYPGAYSNVVQVKISFSKGTSNTRILTQSAIDKACWVHDELWRTGRITSGMTQKEKAWAYFTWMAQNCVYDYDLVNKNYQTAYGALVDGLAVCDGYASGYGLLLLTEGIESYWCELDSGKHACNIAILDGEFTAIDSTGVTMDYINLGINYDPTFTGFAMSMFELEAVHVIPDYLRVVWKGY